jgi:7-keto-8-aminopelargonate synthetase-like enzyme
MQHLEELLQGENAGRVLVITDGVFSMDGDVADLPKIVELCEKYGALSMVDDAHGEGVLGTGGRGIVDHFGLHGRCDIEIGTFSKAIGTVGGFIAGSSVLIQYLKHMLGEADIARKFSAKLFEKGIFAMAIGFPTVPKGKARIRVMISASHQKSDLEFALEQFEAVGKEMGII